MKQFGCFQLDASNECLWQSGTRISVTPKPFAVLRYLVENPQRLVTHEELLNKLWPRTFVQPQVLRTYVLELRKLLGDSVDSPQFIRTVPGRGYWFVARVDEAGAYVSAAPQQGQIVGREQELEQLLALLRLAARGERQTIFLTGETGIGKTALIDCFCRQPCSDDRVHIARGQCTEGFAGKQAYYPVMEALAQQAGSREAPAGAEHGDRTLHEMCEAIEALAREKTLIVVFEDLHWADLATLDLISALARRRQAARLLLLASYRPGDVSAGQHPLKQLKQDLVTHRLCVDVPLGPLTRDAVQEYLVRALNQSKLPAGLASFVHQHCEGNPLFMMAMLEHLIVQKWVRKHAGAWELHASLAELDPGVPTVLSEMIEMQIERLDLADQHMLEAASLIGVIFPVWAAAAALNSELENSEDHYERLARRLHFLHRAGHDELPDGTRSAFYVFAHSLYREVLRERQSPARRARRHLRVAEKMEQLFAARAVDVSLELAMHYEAAADWTRAAKALHTAAESAMRRGAGEESLQLADRAQQLLRNLSAPERTAESKKLAGRLPKRSGRKLDENSTAI